MSALVRPSPGRRHALRRGTALLLLLLITIAVMPAITKVARSLDSSSWVQICTKDGAVRAIYTAQGETLPNPADDALSSQLLLNGKHASDEALPPTSAHGIATAVTVQMSAVADAQASPSRTHPWPDGRPRAPPIRA